MEFKSPPATIIAFLELVGMMSFRILNQNERCVDDLINYSLGGLWRICSNILKSLAKCIFNTTIFLSHFSIALLL